MKRGIPEGYEVGFDHHNEPYLRKIEKPVFSAIMLSDIEGIIARGLSNEFSDLAISRIILQYLHDAGLAVTK